MNRYVIPVAGALTLGALGFWLILSGSTLLTKISVTVILAVVFQILAWVSQRKVIKIEPTKIGLIGGILLFSILLFSVFFLFRLVMNHEIPGYILVIVLPITYLTVRILSQIIPKRK